MEKQKNRKKQIEKVVLGAIFTALVVLLQYLGAFIRFGPFQVSLVLVPIVIGAAMCGAGIGAWLGFVFGMVVLINGDAAPFLAIDVFGTILTVLLKGTACGLCAGLVFNAVEKFNKYVAVVVAAIVCPIVNTGIFLLGCIVFFMDAIREWGLSGGFDGTFQYMILGLVGGNFLFEIASNIVLSPVIVRFLHIVKKNK